MERYITIEDRLLQHEFDGEMMTLGYWEVRRCLATTGDSILLFDRRDDGAVRCDVIAGEGSSVQNRVNSAYLTADEFAAIVERFEHVQRSPFSPYIINLFEKHNINTVVYYEMHGLVETWLHVGYECYGHYRLGPDHFQELKERYGDTVTFSAFGAQEYKERPVLDESDIQKLAGTGTSEQVIGLLQEHLRNLVHLVVMISQKEDDEYKQMVIEALRTAIQKGLIDLLEKKD